MTWYMVKDNAGTEWSFPIQKYEATVDTIRQMGREVISEGYTTPPDVIFHKPKIQLTREQLRNEARRHANKAANKINQ